MNPPQQIKYEKGGGFVEISSEDYLKRANIEGVSLNGEVLLDPRNIYVRDSSLEEDNFDEVILQMLINMLMVVQLPTE